MRTVAIGAVILVGFCAALLRSQNASGAEQVTGDAQRGYTLVLAAGTPVTISGEGLTVELIDVKDSRCPQGFTCVSAGHAAVTLRVTQAGAEPRTIVIGTRAPPSMNLPFEATAGVYRFSLKQLEPRNRFGAKPAVAEYKATVAIARQ